jgi:hypothetical protein
MRRRHVKAFGLGDVVAFIAQPIAAATDAVFKTDIKHCPRCKRRRRDWNQTVPDLLHPFRRG